MVPKVIFCLLIVSVYSSIASGQCDPDCSNSPYAGYKVPDPKYSCSRYYTCLPGGIPSSDPMSCPPGLSFSVGDQDCIDYACPPNIICRPKGCHLACRTSTDFIADAFDCSIYYSCSINGKDEMHLCPPDAPYFDHAIGRCKNDMTVCCSPSCEPSCEYDTITTAEPTDCHKYYICDTNNKEPIFPAQSCGNNIYDTSIGICSSYAECNVWCSGCLDSFMCPASGYFRKCDVCDPRYFFCSAAGQPGIEQVCPDGLVFNPVPGLPYCLDPELCPTGSL